MRVMRFSNGEVIGNGIQYGVVKAKTLLEQIFNSSYILQNIFTALLKITYKPVI